VQVRLGRLDPRLNLAPCSRIEPHLPPGMRLWGAARIGLRCTDAGVRWNVFLPITVDIFGPALVAGGALPAGTPLTASSVQTAIVNLSEAASPPLTRAEDAVGRVLARPVAAGQPLRDGDLRTRQWFDAGDTVRIVAGGAGWRVHAEGKALNPGIEGRTVRVRTESGRVVSGLAAGERTVEVSL
jgi:flagella basal body P-ring formation protein FlgA